jgi:predicted PurR-regulated permease PerM
VVPSSTEQQTKPERIESAQKTVARGKAAPHDIASTGILVLAVLAVIYTLYFGKEILLPIALALVLKLLLKPAMRLLHERLRVPGTVAALLLIIAVFGAIAVSVSQSLSPLPAGFKRPPRACRC